MLLPGRSKRREHTDPGFGSEEQPTPARVRSQPQSITVPVVVSGVLDRRKTAHFFAFDAAAGDCMTFEVDSMKLGYLDDPVLGLYTSEGALLDFADDRLQQNGNQPPNLDPYMVHRFETAGRYVVLIRDSAERGDPTMFTLAIRAERDFELRTQTGITLFAAGLVFPARVRRNGGWENIDVWAASLPPVCVNKVTVEPRTPSKDNCALNRRMDGTDVKVPFHVAADAAALPDPTAKGGVTARQSSTMPRSSIGGSQWAKSPGRPTSKNSWSRLPICRLLCSSHPRLFRFRQESPAGCACWSPASTVAKRR
jgi:hypothetical protein